MLCGISMDSECTCYSSMQNTEYRIYDTHRETPMLKINDDDNDDAVSHRTLCIKHLQNGCTVERRTA